MARDLDLVSLLSVNCDLGQATALGHPGFCLYKKRTLASSQDWEGSLQLDLMPWMCSRLSWLGARVPPFLSLLRHHSSKSRFQAKYGTTDSGFSTCRPGPADAAAFQATPNADSETLRMAKSQTGQEGQGNKELPDTSKSSSVRHSPLTQNRHVPAR